MAEEQRCQPPEGHRLCANNCGFFGSSATMNLCSKCYRDLRLKEQQQVSIKSAISASTSAAPETGPLSSPVLSQPEIVRSPAVADATGAAAAAAVAQPNRCFMCRKRVGLTGFRCRCGTTFCGVHRYPEKHGCSFDFKKLGKEEIARANPVIKAEKLGRFDVIWTARSIRSGDFNICGPFDRMSMVHLVLAIP